MGGGESILLLGDIWQYLGTFLDVTMKELLQYLLEGGYRSFKYPTMHRTSPDNKNELAQMPIGQS